MNTKIIIVFGILLLIVEVGIIGFLVYLKNQAPSPEEQAKLTEDTCGPLAESGGGPDVLGLSTARSKATDASIKANLASARTYAEIYYEDHSNYGDFVASAERSENTCSLAGTMFEKNNQQSAFIMISEAERRCEPDTRWVATCALGGSEGVATTYAVSVPLKAGGSWCVDSTGASRMGKTEGGGGNPARCSGSAPEPMYPPQGVPVVPL